MILNKDWDILILLDACRYDFFKKCNSFEGKLSKVIGGTNTKSFFRKNFDGADCSNIIYINPIIKFNEWFPSNNFFEVIPSWDKCWSKNFGTVLPESVTELSIKYIKKYPKKRIIVHYMQPHIPYLSLGTKYVKASTRNEVANERESKLKEIMFSTINKAKITFPSIPIWYMEKLFGSSAGIGEIYFNGGFKAMRKAYKENLNNVLNYVKKIIEITDGNVVITSDHGEMLGEMGMVGHGRWKHKNVINVPWFEVAKKDIDK